MAVLPECAEKRRTRDTGRRRSRYDAGFANKRSGRRRSIKLHVLSQMICPSLPYSNISHLHYRCRMYTDIRVLHGARDATALAQHGGFAQAERASTMCARHYGLSSLLSTALTFRYLSRLRRCGDDVSVALTKRCPLNSSASIAKIVCSMYCQAQQPMEPSWSFAERRNCSTSDLSF
jgi:hypothetical protein